MDSTNRNHKEFTHLPSAHHRGRHNLMIEPVSKDKFDIDNEEDLFSNLSQRLKDAISTVINILKRPKMVA